MKKDIVNATLAVLVLTLILGVVYPLAVTGVSQLAFPGNANGQMLYLRGRLVGSKIIGQPFATQVVKHGKPQVDKSGNPVTAADPRYFQPRPSATVPPYNSAATAFSNLGPNSVLTARTIASNIAAYLELNKPYDPSLTRARVPVDAANSSASGVDPGISVANADIQAHRIAALRHLATGEVDRMISAYTAGRGLGFSGEPAVNALELNLALDRLGGAR